MSNKMGTSTQHLWRAANLSQSQYRNVSPKYVRLMFLDLPTPSTYLACVRVRSMSNC
jgi:hypothetical protein